MTRWVMACASLAGMEAAAQPTWWRTYGGFGSDGARDVRGLSDGGAIIAGSTGSFGLDGDAYVLRVDAQGAHVWSVVVGGPGVQAANAVVTDVDGCYVAGMTQLGSDGDYDGWIARIAADGTLEWQRSFGSSEWDWFNGLHHDEAGVHLCGVSYATGLAKGWLVRIDLAGNLVWQSDFNGDDASEAAAVVSTPDGACFVVGTIANGTDRDVAVARFESNGVMDWFLPFGTDSLDQGLGLCLTQDAGLAVTGSTRGFRPYPQLMIAKVSTAGQLVWLQHWGEGAEFVGADIVERPDGGLAIAGHTAAFGAGGKDCFLLKADADGGYDLGATFGGGDEDVAYGIDMMPDGGFILAGRTKSFGPGSQAVFVVRADADADTESDLVTQYLDPVGMAEQPNARLAAFHPNPVGECRLAQLVATDAALKEWRLRDASGRLVISGGPCAPVCRIDLSGVGCGAYVMETIDGAGHSRAFPIVLQ